MQVYLLDTNVCIDLIRENNPGAQRRYQQVLDDDGVMLLSSIVAAELWFGVGKSDRKEHNSKKLESFFAGPLYWTAFEQDDAQEAGVVRAELETRGQRIGAHDLLLAGQALRHNAILVTANKKDFERIDGLMWEDWSEQRDGAP